MQSCVAVIAELLGGQDGMSRGKGGLMHIFTPSFFGGNGIVGAQVHINAGIAFAQKYLGKKRPTFALYSDGASNQGQVFEAFNIGLLKFSSEPRFEPEPGELNSGFWFGSGSVLPLSCRFWFWFGAPALSAELVLNWFEPEPDRV